MGDRLRRGFGIRTRLAVAHIALAAGGIALLAHEARAHLTQQELHFLYEVNRARHDPPGWAVEQGLGSRTGGDGQPTTLVGVEPRPPLAMNELLVDSAGSKAEEMAAANYFDHHSHVGPDFLFPNELVRSFGYPLPINVPFPGGGGFYSFPDDFNSLESIACGAGGGTNDLTQAIHALTFLIVDADVPSLGHRNHLLATNEFNSLFTEAGAGYGINDLADCHNYWAFHTGVTDPAGQFLTGSSTTATGTTSSTQARGSRA